MISTYKGVFLLGVVGQTTSLSQGWIGFWCQKGGKVKRANAFYVAEVCVEHSSILLHGGRMRGGSIPSKFKNMWLKIDGFKKMWVRGDGWDIISMGCVV